MEREHWRWFALLAGVVIAVLAIAGTAIRLSIGDLEHSGQFGDMFGMVNALFSGLAFAGLIYTIHLQRKELALQREELRLTRDELARSATAQQEAEKALRAQVEMAHNANRLTTLNILYETYTKSLDELDRYIESHSNKLLNGGVHCKMKNEERDKILSSREKLKEKIANLYSIIEMNYNSITGTDKQ